MQQQKRKERIKEHTKAKAWKPPQEQKTKTQTNKHNIPNTQNRKHKPKPQLKRRMKLMVGTKFQIATLNIKGTKNGSDN